MTTWFVHHLQADGDEEDSFENCVDFENCVNVESVLV